MSGLRPKRRRRFLSWLESKIQHVPVQDVIRQKFTYRHKDMHYSRHRVTEMVPGKRVVWLTTESKLSFVDQKDEWTGSTIVFEIAQKDGRTTVEFIHDLGPELECFSDCSNAWGFYVRESLRSLIATGKGKPDPK